MTDGVIDTPSSLHVYVDGSHEPSRIRGGWAFVVYRDGEEIAFDRGEVEGGDNGTMELMALLRGIEWIREIGGDAPSIVFSDSAYAVNGCNLWRARWRSNGWKRRAAGGRGRNRSIPYADLWKAIDRCLIDNPAIGIEWCKGHGTVEGNLRADALARPR